MSRFFLLHLFPAIISSILFHNVTSRSGRTKAMAVLISDLRLVLAAEYREMERISAINCDEYNEDDDGDNEFAISCLEDVIEMLEQAY